MAKLRVGHTQVSPGRVDLGTTQDSDQSASLPEPSQLLRLIAEERVPRALLLAVGVALLALGITAALSSSIGATPFGLWGRVLIAPGLTLTGAATAWPLVRRWAARELMRQEGAVLAPVLLKLRPHLGPPKPECTSTVLSRLSGFPLPVLMRALRWLRDSGEIVEELDLRTGEFYYGTASEGIDVHFTSIGRGQSR
jgi:hypothetical protein